MTTETSPKRMGITVGELIGASLVVLGAVLTFWISTERRLTALELQMKDQAETRTSILQKLDKLQYDISDIKVNLQNKQDRPTHNP